MASGIRKLDDEWLREQAAIAERGNREHLAKHDRSFYGHLAKLADAADGDDDNRNRNNGGNASVHPAVQIAGLLVASGKFPGHAQALDHLLNTSRGQALLHRMSKAAAHTGKETAMTSTHAEFVRDVVKQYGIVALAKSMVKDQKAYGLDEHEFTKLATEHAQRVYPSDRPDVAFSKLYQSEESVRRACQVAKAMPFVVSLEPLQVGGESARDVNNPDEAIAQLKQLGARKWPTASESVQFENALVDPVNHKLARRAVPIPQPTTSYPFPV